MMRWIIGSSIKFRYLVVAGAAALIAVGVLQLRDSPVDVFPEFAPPRVEIQTITLGLSATETEELVTVPLEQALQGLPDLDTIRSKSVPLLSSITLYFERGTDQLKARQLVAERVGNVTPGLPTWAAPPVMIQPLSATSRVMKIGLSSDTVSLIDMSMLAYWKIRARLLTVPGRRERADLGRAASHVPGRGRSRADGVESGLSEPGHGEHVTGAGLGAPLLLERIGDRYRRVRRHAEPAADGRARSADRHA